jgi:hypothetical protein
MISPLAIPTATPEMTSKTRTIRKGRKTPSLALSTKSSGHNSGPLDEEGVYIRRAMSYHLIGRNTTVYERYVMARKSEGSDLAKIMAYLGELLLADREDTMVIGVGGSDGVIQDKCPVRTS